MLTRKTLFCICFFIIGLLCIDNIYSKAGISINKGTQPRSIINTGITTATNGTDIISLFDFDFGIVKVDIKNKTGQTVYTTQINTGTITYSTIRNVSLPTGEYVITYTNTYGEVIDSVDLYIQ